MKTLNFAKNFTANVEITDLEKLGWTFEYDDTANAMNISDEEAEKYVKDTYDIEITVKEEGKTFWRYFDTKKAANRIDEGSDNEATGDDGQTIEDLKKLYAQGKLYNEKNFIG